MPGDHIEEGALPGAIGADHRHDLALPDVHVQAGEGVEAAEVLLETAHLQDRIGAQDRRRIAHVVASVAVAISGGVSPSSTAFAHSSWARSSSWSSRLRRTFGMSPCGRRIITATTAAP